MELKRKKNLEEQLRRDTAFSETMRMGIGDPESDRLTGPTLSKPLNRDAATPQGLPHLQPRPGDAGATAASSAASSAAPREHRKQVTATDAKPPDVDDSLFRPAQFSWPEINAIGPRGERLNDPLPEPNVARDVANDEGSANPRPSNKEGKRPAWRNPEAANRRRGHFTMETIEAAERAKEQSAQEAFEAARAKARQAVQEDEDAIIPAIYDYPHYLDEDGCLRRIPESSDSSSVQKPSRYEVARGVSFLSSRPVTPLTSPARRRSKEELLLTDVCHLA
jgi:hypothetical protein